MDIYRDTGEGREREREWIIWNVALHCQEYTIQIYHLNWYLKITALKTYLDQVNQCKWYALCIFNDKMNLEFS